MEEGSNDRVLEIKTQRGSIAVGYRGFKYNKDKEYLEHKKISWRCSQRGCTGRLETTQELTNPAELQHHSHFPNDHHLRAESALATMKSRAKQETIPIPVFYKQESSRRSTAQKETRANDAGRLLMPPFYSVKSGLYNSRRSTQPTLPIKWSEILIPPLLSKTISGAEFLLQYQHQTGIIVFATIENLGWLARHKQWYMDGTFDVSPLLYLQLFTIHAFVDASKCLLCLRCFQTNSEPITLSSFVQFVTRLQCTGKFSTLRHC